MTNHPTACRRTAGPVGSVPSRARVAAGFVICRASTWHAQQRGIALIWVLLLGGFLAAVVLTFITTASTERVFAKHDQSDLVTDELLGAARSEVLAKLTEGFALEKGTSPRRAHTAAMPGLLEVRRYDVVLNRGSQRGAAAFRGTADNPAPFSQPFSDTFNGQPANPRWIPLFSWKAFAPRLKNLTVSGGAASRENPDYNPALSFNLNTPDNPFTPGACLLSGVAENAETLLREKVNDRWARSGDDDSFRTRTGQTSAERPVWVQWIPVLKDPSKAPSKDNPIIGRYAYWVDLENSKLRVDAPWESLRERPESSRLLGEPDAVEGGGSWFAQATGTSQKLRETLEAMLPVTSSDGAISRTRDGGGSPGFAPAAAQEAREAWLGWLNGRPPAAAGASLVDWSYFESPWRKGHPTLTVASALQEQRETWQTSPKSKPVHPWVVMPAQRGETSSAESLQHGKLLRQVAASSLTTWGHEEELDPLGRRKVSLTDFQLAVTGNRSSTVSLDAIKQSVVWERLKDTNYYECYYPGAAPAMGVAKCFFDTWNRFAGTGSEVNFNNGGFATLQMLANIAEFAQPADVPPVIDESQGIVGARSMPYVAEVGTRARSAYWLLPASVRADHTELLKRPAGGGYAFTYAGKPLQYYATNVTLDLVLGFVNPNPYDTEMFEGEVEVDIAWGKLPTGAEVQSGPFKSTLRGRFSPTPEPGKDPDRLRVGGHTVTFNLGIVPATALNDANYASMLRIKGWRILRNGVVWHQVPVKHPGARGTREWWQMAQSGQNAGSPGDTKSLAAYQAGGYRAVGLFTKETMDSLIANSLFVTSWTNASDSSTALRTRVEKWAQLTGKTSALERVVSLDPVLGHRTGDPMLTGWFGAGQFYGALGHTWRRRQFREEIQVAAPSETFAQTASLQVQPWDMQPSGTQRQSVRAQRAAGDNLVLGTTEWSKTAWSAVSAGPAVGGEYITHKLISPSNAQASSTSLPDSLTGIYLVPSVEGPAPQGCLRYEEYFKDIALSTAASPQKVKNLDVEAPLAPLPPDNGDFTKGPDGKKGARSILCSAPAGRPCISVGEIGFCHSGFPQTPIMVGPDEGRTDYQLNSPRNGPPMRMLLDIFSAPQFTDENGRPLTESQWMSGSASPPAERHAWNVNTTVAHDDYMALRESGGLLLELKKENNVAPLAAHAIWMPNAQAFSRRLTGSDAFTGKEAKHLYEKDPGHAQDRHMRPFPVIARPWDMWLGVVGGDFSPARSGESLMWGVGASAALWNGPAFLTWRPGKGVGASDAQPWIDFKTDPPALGRLLALGVDARKDDSNSLDGQLKGRFAADQNLLAFEGTLPYYVPAHLATRYSLLPVRHHLSDVAVDFHQDGAESYWTRFKTALNPGISAEPLPEVNETMDKDSATEAADKLDGASYAGGYHQSGVFYNAPMALLTNQAGISANAFTAYVIVQAVRDTGKSRQGVANSGPGHCDFDDVVLAERWARVVITKMPSSSSTKGASFRVVMQDVAGR